MGKKFAQWGRQGTVIGVVKDFHFRSLHTKVEPLALRYGIPDDLNRIVVSVKGNSVASTVPGIEKTWKSVAPQRPSL